MALAERSASFLKIGQVIGVHVHGLGNISRGYFAVQIAEMIFQTRSKVR